MRKYAYTDGGLAKIGDRVKFRTHLGYAGSHTMEAEGTIKSFDPYGATHIDISPLSYRKDCGRFGTQETNIVTLFGSDHLSGKFAGLCIITQSGVDWTLDYPSQKTEWIVKLEGQAQ